MQTRRMIVAFSGVGIAFALIPVLAHANDNQKPLLDGERFKVTADEKILLDFIAESEGTASQADAGFNTSLDYGRWLPGGKEQLLTSLTLDEIEVLQRGMLAQPANIARYGGSSAMGRYQIVRRTLSGLRSELGLRGNEFYNQEMQDRLALHLARRRGASKGLGQEWASLKGHKLDKAMKLAEKAFSGAAGSKGFRR